MEPKGTPALHFEGGVDERGPKNEVSDAFQPDWTPEEEKVLV